MMFYCVLRSGVGGSNRSDFVLVILRVKTFSYILLSNPKQPSCKKRSTALKKAMVKKDVKSKVAAKKWL